MVFWPLCRRVLIGFLVGFVAGAAIWAAQRAAHQPPRMTLAGTFFLGGVGALIGWLVFRFRERQCPRCGHTMGKGDIYFPRESTHSWLDHLNDWKRLARRESVALYNCQSCRTVYRLVGADGLAAAQDLVLVNAPVELTAGPAERSQRGSTENDRGSLPPPTACQRDRFFFLRHRIFWVNVAAFIGGTYFLWSGWEALRDGAASVQWASVPARVVSSEVVQSEGESAANHPQIAYAYEVNGKTYRGSRISFGSTDDRTAEQIVGQYYVGAAVPVYYAADDPQRSVLEPGVTFGGGAIFFLGCLLPFLVVGLPLWRAGRRQLVIGGMCLVGGLGGALLMANAGKSHAAFAARQQRQQREQAEAAHQRQLAEIRESQNRVQGTRWIDSRFSSSITFDEQGGGEIVDGTLVQFGRQRLRRGLRYTQEHGRLTMVLESGGSIRAEVLVIQRQQLMFRKIAPTGPDAIVFARMLQVARFTRSDQQAPVGGG